ncbi:PDZ domain-containing protein [Halorubrum sp. JWXQ-INN 858]|uniref:S1C family serine protease n=1 Tax=Halorubrum sp. JWXQ-INN 858 TaxID=2690782 RepID=UPI001358FB24|nr:trypsin-like peptidase domain-containing protein [Halorubrum sp. JWXQ-INN 858]MWV64320.1 PDZ domain-containing protein [Halorubrum sp. JWXQ-INN 858]
MKRTRREVLGLGATMGAIAATAGCLAPTNDDGRVGVDGGNPTAAAAESTEPAEPADAPRVESNAGYTEVYEAVSPSVARVQTYRDGAVGGLFGDDGDGGDGGGEAGQGSGFRYAEDYLVTNDHVLADADTVRVQASDGTWLDASVVGRDPYSDLAVVETAGSLPGGPLALAEAVPATGTEVLVVGSPLGLEGTATQGIVSGRNRTIPATVTEAGRFSIADAVQTDAALNPGNSGGPIVTLDGDVIGVATATRGENVGFGVSARLVGEVVPELIGSGGYDHSYMGVSVLPVEPLLATANDLPEARGVYVADVADGGPADGVLRGADGETSVEGATVPVGGDTVVALDETPVEANADLSRFLALETRPGDVIEVTVRRDGETRTVDLTLGSRPDP